MEGVKKAITIMGIRYWPKISTKESVRHKPDERQCINGTLS